MLVVHLPSPLGAPADAAPRDFSRGRAVASSVPQRPVRAAVMRLLSTAAVLSHGEAPRRRPAELLHDAAHAQAAAPSARRSPRAQRSTGTARRQVRAGSTAWRHARGTTEIPPPQTPHTRSQPPRSRGPRQSSPRRRGSTSRRTVGHPGDRIAGRPVCVTNHPGCRPTFHLHLEVLRRPPESALRSVVGVMDQLAARLASTEGHHQRSDDEVSGLAFAHGPTTME